MAMKLEFWEADGPNGEAQQAEVRVSAATMIQTFEQYKNSRTVMVTLAHTSRQRGEWVVWVKRGYTSGTRPMVGKVEVL